MRRFGWSEAVPRDESEHFAVVRSQPRKLLPHFDHVCCRWRRSRDLNAQRLGEPFDSRIATPHPPLMVREYAAGDPEQPEASLNAVGDMFRTPQRDDEGFSE